MEERGSGFFPALLGNVAQVKLQAAPEVYLIIHICTRRSSQRFRQRLVSSKTYAVGLP